MKKIKTLIVLVLIVLSIQSCTSDTITIMDVETGKTNIIRDRMHVSKLSDTLVVTSMTRTLSSGEFVFTNTLYGRYVGFVPKDLTNVRGRTVTYHKVIRIK